MRTKDQHDLQLHIIVEIRRVDLFPPREVILGVIDGYSTAGIETEKDIEERKSFLRKIGYKF